MAPRSSRAFAVIESHRIVAACCRDPVPPVGVVEVLVGDNAEIVDGCWNWLQALPMTRSVYRLALERVEPAGDWLGRRDPRRVDTLAVAFFLHVVEEAFRRPSGLR